MKKLKIIYEDKNIIVINKPSNQLTISTNQEKEKTLYHEVLEYLRKKNQKVFIVHRLDKETTGLIIFAKNEKSKNILQKNWNNTKRYYIALVEGKVDQKGERKTYLKETKTHLTYSSKEGKLAHTLYEPTKFTNNFTLLKIQILTGRKNQIRCHMKEINHPIVGDKKYGSKYKNKLCLTAYKIIFTHPITNKELSLEIPIPKEYENYVEKSNKIAK